MPETKQVPQFVTKDTKIAQAVMQYPVTAEIMLSYGLHCVGCHVAGVESIEQGARGHGGMDDEDVEMLIAEMNEAIAEREGFEGEDEFAITAKAAEKIKEFAAEEEDPDGLFLRVSVVPGGCSGFKYGLEFDHDPADEDEVFSADGFEVRVDPDSLELLEGAVLDYVDGLNGSGFKFENPNASSKCGCGSSFS